MKLNLSPRVAVNDPLLQRELREHAQQVNNLAEGRIAAVTNAQAVPNPGEMAAKADFIRNPNPVIIGASLPDAYIVWGHVCLGDGSPGTWYEMRMPVFPYQFPDPVGPDPSFSSVSLLVPMNAADGFTDRSPVVDSIAVVGNTVISSAQPLFADSMGYFDGSGDYLNVAHSADFNLGTGDFTDEMWVYATSVGGGQYRMLLNRQAFGATVAAYQLRITDTGKLEVLFRPNGGSAASINSVASVPANSLVHLAVTRASGTVRLFINGNLDGSASYPSSFDPPSSQRLLIGALDTGTPSTFFLGYMGWVRRTKGVARYTATFTPPTSPFPTF